MCEKHVKKKLQLKTAEEYIKYIMECIFFLFTPIFKKKKNNYNDTSRDVLRNEFVLYSFVRVVTGRGGGVKL